jgi:phage/plasmid-like protein (TIGR03299 family)
MKGLWSELGYKFEDQPASVAHAMSEAGIDYNVGKTNVKAEAGFHEMTVDDHFVTYRLDEGKPLGVVGNHYEIVQNKVAFELVDTLMNLDDDITFQSAGTFGQGEVAWMLLNLPYEIPVNGRDIQAQALIKNGFDGSQTISARFFAEDLICSNGMTAVTDQGSVSIRHTQTAEGRIESAKMVLETAFNAFEGMEETIVEWLDTPFDYERMQELADRLFPKDDEGERSTKAEHDREALLDCFEAPIGPMEGFEDTAYQAYNAITEFTRHEKTVRPGDKSETEARTKSVFETSGARFEKKGVRELEAMID